MTKQKKPAPAPELYESRKAILRLVERVYEESKYLRFRASELALDLVYPEIVSTTRKPTQRVEQLKKLPPVRQRVRVASAVADRLDRVDLRRRVSKRDLCADGGRARQYRLLALPLVRTLGRGRASARGAQRRETRISHGRRRQRRLA